MNPKATHYDVPLPLEGLPPTEREKSYILTEEAIALVDAHAQPEWKVQALEAIETLAHAQPDLTTDDVWHYLRMHDVEPSHEKRAMGSVMRSAAKAGLIRITDSTRKSGRIENHMRPVRVWRSLVHDGPSLHLVST